MICPPPCCFIKGKAARQVKKVPVKLVSRTPKRLCRRGKGAGDILFVAHITNERAYIGCAEFARLGGNALQRVFRAREQTQAQATLSQRQRCCAPDAG
jgi:hypothetical protein